MSPDFNDLDDIRVIARRICFEFHGMFNTSLWHDNALNVGSPKRWYRLQAIEGAVKAVNIRECRQFVKRLCRGVKATYWGVLVLLWRGNEDVWKRKRRGGWRDLVVFGCIVWHETNECVGR